ncbi:MAG: NAD-dependent epimerase/dehydratase family protein [Bryobacteraceae bacterium]
MAGLTEEDLQHVFEHARTCWRELAGARIFVTGATGFVGKWLLESLLFASDRLNLSVRITALTRDPARFRVGFPHLALHSAVELLAGDAATFPFPHEEYPFVVHAATEPSWPASSAAPTSNFDANVAGTRRVLEFARQRGARRFLLTSSGAVYGRQPSEMTHIPEEYRGAPDPHDPATAYGQAKRVSEFLSAMYARQFGFDVLIARLFAFSGPYLPLDQNFAVGNFVRDAASGGPIQVKGDGTAYRSYLYAADLAVWLWTILTRGESGRPYNVGSADAVTIGELARSVAKAAGTGVEVVTAHSYTPGKPAERYVPCVERSARELGLTPRIDLLEGLRRMYAAAPGNPRAAEGSRRECPQPAAGPADAWIGMDKTGNF